LFPFDSGILGCPLQGNGKFFSFPGGKNFSTVGMSGIDTMAFSKRGFGERYNIIVNCSLTDSPMS
jgi:hypothetical protein